MSVKFQRLGGLGEGPGRVHTCMLRSQGEAVVGQ